MKRFQPLLKQYRRRRKHSASTWTPKRHNDQLLTDTGLLCRECGKWRRWSDLEIEFEVYGQGFKRIWWCAFCGNMLKEDMVP